MGCPYRGHAPATVGRRGCKHAVTSDRSVAVNSSVFRGSNHARDVTPSSRSAMPTAKLSRARPVPRRLWWRALAALVALASGTDGLIAQTPTGTVSGRVVADNNQPLAGAQVSLRGTGLGTRTSNNGRYTIVNVPAGPYRLRTQMLGHRPVEDTVTIVAGQTTTRDVT